MDELIINALIIVVIAVFYSCFSLFINRKIGKRKETMEIQAKMNTINKELRQAIKEKNDSKIKELEKQQREIMPLMTKVMFNSLKPMIVILPAFFIIIWLVTSIVPSFSIDLGFGIPMFHPGTVYGTRGFFVLVTVIIGIPLGMIVNHFDKKSMANENQNN
ncbi:DUF106 domain-containing protein [Candidatus Micrarchaeota archaeon]|nr:DUF106 domain-containing protein [Candidatus Micrarchaeota archaeon]